jgi:hypothetical protein
MKYEVLIEEIRFSGSIEGFLWLEVNYYEGINEEKIINNIKIVFFLVSIFSSFLVYVFLFLLAHHVDSYILKIVY